ncbi:MAG TPA: hypothetical protein VMV22_12085 [Acidimicrobiales bacterium]|nr:hypothetical protein [Acidimicrobiales bacterium]
MSTRRASAPPRGSERRWFTGRAVVAHIALLVWVPGCIVACWWQVGVARSGDSLGWVYAVMWPCFAVFASVFWWHFVHDDPATLGRRGTHRLQQAAEDTVDPHEQELRELALAAAEAEDPELAAYNAYLASLARPTPPGRRNSS